MKKFFLFFLIILLSVSAFAQEQEQAQENQQQEQPEQENTPLKILLNFTNFGIGTHLPYFYNDENFYNTYDPEIRPGAFEMSIELLRFGIEHVDTNFAAEFSPFKLFGWAPGGASFSIINFNFYWDLLGFMLEDPVSYYLAPAASINYLFIGNEVELKRYIITLGIQSGIRGKASNIYYNVFSVETGFRVVDGEGRFYAGIKFDFIMHSLKSFF